jgi:hypothetical protein
MFGTEATTTWPQAVIFLGVLLTAMFLIGVAIATFLEFREAGGRTGGHPAAARAPLREARRDHP